MIASNAKIGDGTAPQGWPAYSTHGVGGVLCKWRGCGHFGRRKAAAAEMTCKGRTCQCSCCRMLAGEKEHGVTYDVHR